MRSPRTYAVIINGGSNSDRNTAGAFLSTIHTFFSQGIIPYAYSTYQRDVLFNLYWNTENMERYLFELSTRSSPDSRCELSYSAEQTKDTLDIMRPFYRCVSEDELLLEMKKWVSENVSRLEHGDRLITVICAQGIHESGVMMLGKALTSQEIWENIETLPAGRTVVTISVAPGSEYRKGLADMFKTPRMDAYGEEYLETPQDSEVPRENGRGVYMAAKLDILRALGKGKATFDSKQIRDTGTGNTVLDIPRDGQTIKLSPWTYSLNKWQLVDSVPGHIAELLEQLQRGRGLPGRVQYFLGGVGRRARRTLKRKIEPLDVAMHYIHLRTQDADDLSDGAKPNALKTLMESVIEQYGNSSSFNVLSSLYAGQRCVEATLRFIERSDVRVEAFLQCCYKSGVFEMIDANRINMNPEVETRLTENLLGISHRVESIVFPPADCANMLYHKRAHEIVRLMDYHMKMFDWFRRERFVIFMEEML